MKTIKTLTNFKRLPVGTKIQATWINTFKDGIKNGTIRTIEHKQTNAIRFSGGSWLHYPKATDFKITPKGTLIVSDNGEPYVEYTLIK